MDLGGGWPGNAIGGGNRGAANGGGQDADAFRQSLSRDFYLSNCAGSYACTSELGINSRKYHGLLNYSPSGNPSDALLLLSKLEETATVDGKRYALSSNCYPGAIFPDGRTRLSKFEFHGGFARWQYSLGGQFCANGQNGEVKPLEITREIWMPHGKPSTCIRYSTSKGFSGEILLEAIPLVLGRKASGLGAAAPKFSHTENSVEFSQPAHWGISCNSAAFIPNPLSYLRMQYPLEFERGEGGEEDLFSPGAFNSSLSNGGTAVFSAWVKTGQGASHPAEETNSTPAGGILDAQNRKMKVAENYFAFNSLPHLDHMRPLLYASDSFLTFFNGRHAICAGYPYFGIWGRDTFISLPGIAAMTGRHALARDIIDGMLHFEKDGLLPNFISESGEPSYSAADVSLWAIWSIWQLEKEGGVRQEDRLRWWKALRSIGYHYLKGNSLVRTEEDGLLSLRGERLTWMDAAKNGMAITPRPGRRVEINALWVFGLRYLSDFALKVGDNMAFEALAEAHSNASPPFREFFNEYAHFYDDGIKPTDGALRPNQIWALALPHIPVSPIHARQSLMSIREHLLTPCGLRSLAPNENNYHQHYGGSQQERDGAYHQGAVWPWLFGAYADAILLHQKDRASETLRMLTQFISMPGGAHGTLAEVYDPTNLTPAGCPSQAWSVAETLRACTLLYRAKYATGRLPDLLSEKQ